MYSIISFLYILNSYSWYPLFTSGIVNIKIYIMDAIAKEMVVNQLLFEYKIIANIFLRNITHTFDNI